MKIPFNKPFIVGKELFYIAQAVISEARLAGGGKFTRQCEQLLEERIGGKAFLVHSCTAALEMAAILCDLQPGDEVIMPSFTFVSTANAFVLRGATPVFVDIRRDTLNLDEALIEAAITPRTKAIVPVHYGGVPCNMDRIMEIARRHELWVIEDAAHGLFSHYGNRQLGGIGHLGCFSFHETKNIISGEGGALLVNDPLLVERAEIIREKGTNRSRFFRGEVDKYTWVDLGSSYLPSELVGAFLWAQLERSEQINSQRRQLVAHYHDALADLQQNGSLELANPLGPDAGCGHVFYILTRHIQERSALINWLRRDDIHAVFHYVPLHTSPAGQRFCRSEGMLPVTREMSDRLLRLPLYYELSEEKVDQVVASIRAFYAEKI
nr:dTDP-4-amino-4,6-dideoxygalactose transaminase [uncultured Desulfuromonas sp.]